MKTPHPNQETSHTIYKAPTLAIYDTWVLTLSNRWIWKCPTPLISRHYESHITANHLDVGVGTGYYLNHNRNLQRFSAVRLGLMDCNPIPLKTAADRLARYQPETYQQNVLEPFDWHLPRFDSIACNYLLHCLPGTLAQKCTIFDRLKPLLSDGSALFGSTILHQGTYDSWLSQRLKTIYNQRGIFNNQTDDLPELTKELNQRFDKVEIRVVGSVAIFVAR